MRNNPSSGDWVITPGCNASKAEDSEAAALT